MTVRQGLPYPFQASLFLFLLSLNDVRMTARWAKEKHRFLGGAGYGM
jgi:hypothetical protein